MRSNKATSKPVELKFLVGNLSMPGATSSTNAFNCCKALRRSCSRVFDWTRLLCLACLFARALLLFGGMNIKRNSLKHRSFHNTLDGRKCLAVRAPQERLEPTWLRIYIYVYIDVYFFTYMSIYISHILFFFAHFFLLHIVISTHFGNLSP